MSTDLVLEGKEGFLFLSDGRHNPSCALLRRVKESNSSP